VVVAVDDDDVVVDEIQSRPSVVVAFLFLDSAIGVFDFCLFCFCIEQSSLKDGMGILLLALTTFLFCCIGVVIVVHNPNLLFCIGEARSKSCTWL